MRIQNPFQVTNVNLTSPRRASSMTIRTGESEQIPINLMMCGWSNWRIMSEITNVRVSDVFTLREPYTDTDTDPPIKTWVV